MALVIFGLLETGLFALAHVEVALECVPSYVIVTVDEENQ